VTAALLAGVLGGVGGAAGYSALTDDGTPSPASQNAFTSAVSSQPDTAAPAGSIEAVAAKVLPSVVQINVASATAAGSGSGIILTSDGLILTNNHVAEVAANGGRIAVSFNNGATASAKIVGRDPLTDLAVIQAQGVSGLKPATLGSSATLDVGEQVLAVGSPFGLSSTVTSGIVSALNRPVSPTEAGSPGSGGTNNTNGIFPGIQTDAAINPGNSGGPLVNMQGQVVGINSAIFSDSNSTTSQGGSIGLGFAIPIDEAKPIAQQLSNGQTATHAKLGVLVSDAVDSQGLPGGAKVGDVTAKSAAANAGLKSGDVITAIDGQEITSADSLVATVRTYRPGDHVTLTVHRGDATSQLPLTLGSDAS
jgi:putative serine protease PepD